jgi:hypothetical protein
MCPQPGTPGSADETGNQFRRGVVTNTGPNWKLDIDLRFDGFDATDRLFAASGDTVYWQSGNQFRRGVVTNTGPNWKLDIDLRFDGFDATDRLFAASGDTVFWQAARQFRRGQVA